MAAGLKLGEKLEIAGKKHRILNDVIDVDQFIGELQFSRFEGHQTRFEDGVDTGEILGILVELRFKDHEDMDTILLTDMSEASFEELGLKWREEVELIDPVVSIASIDGVDNYNIFASGIRKKAMSQPKQEQKKDNPNQHNNG
ncbi:MULTISPECIES: conjugal transfer protein [Streptococcus]|uniref:Conjugal transfer protein n=1 Tax=Streptococcus caledonicus TaxID=2614158 RepID=A0ABW0UEP4_9STRE|nr:conjugal transfer protein [Streptococcus sp. S784/96/1]